MTEDDVRRLALALPGTGERPSYGTPGFRVKDRLFARIREDGLLAVWVEDEFEKDAMLQTDPAKFTTLPHYDGHPMVLVQLEAVDEQELRELLTDSWQLRGGTTGTRWTCPRCERQFARAKQAHDCRPGTDVDTVLAGRPEGQRRAYDAIVEHLRSLGELHEDAVGVGVFLKRVRKFAELRPKQRWLSVSVRPGPGHDWQTERVTDAADVDDALRARLSEAYGNAQ